MIFIKKILLVSVIAFLSFSYASAQIHIGLTTAFNGTFVLDKGLNEDPRYISTVTTNFAPIGFDVGVDFSRGFGLQLESIISRQGQIYDVIDAAKQAVGTREIDLSYIHVPLLFKFMSGGDSQVRSNFSLGPQLSLLTSGIETLQYGSSSQFFPEGGISDLVDNNDGTFSFTDVQNNIDIMNVTRNADGSYNLQELNSTEVALSGAQAKFEDFKNAELQIAGSFGVDIDVSKNLSISTIIRANYSISDMRNGDLVEFLNNNSAEDLFTKRANLLVGVQLGVNYYISGTRFFK